MCDITNGSSQSCDGSDITKATPPSSLPSSSAASLTLWTGDVIVSAADRLTQSRAEWMDESMDE